MTFKYRVIVLALAGCALSANAAEAQTPAGAVKVNVTCAPCDMAALKTAVSFAEFVADEAASEVTVAITSAPDGPMDRWTLTIKGRGQFAGRDRTLSFSEDRAKSAASLARYFKLGIAEFAAATPLGKQLDLGFKKAVTASGAPPIKKDQKDPWNYWVFRLGASAYTSGEQSSAYNSYGYSGSANRTTERWKFRLSGNRNVNTSRYDLDEETTIKSDTRSWDLYGLAVKSLGPRWSGVASGNASGSTFSNQRHYTRIAAGAEFDVYPYAESSRRSLTFSYTVGPSHYAYSKLTIFDKLDETVFAHVLNASFGLRQPWGQIGASAGFNQQLNHLDRNRLNVSANGNIRIFKSLTLNASGSYSRIRDQFTLEKGTASEEEVLLRLRQLATGYRYSFNVGFGYAFGALSNTTVNPRFGG